jgi:hypothetical protein
MIEEEFLGWLDCEVENVTLRKELLYKWMLAAFSEGWQAG